MTFPVFSLSGGEMQRLPLEAVTVRICGNVLWLCEFCSSMAFVIQGGKIYCADCYKDELAEEQE